MNKVKNIFIVFIIMLFTYSIINAQKQIENSFLRSLFEPAQYNNIDVPIKTSNAIENNSMFDAPIHSINNHLKEAAMLKAQGKSVEEINIYFNSQRLVVGTGSISGIVYESDGATLIQDFCSIEAYNEYGKYMGSDYTNDYKNGEYSITDLPSGKYYVRTSSEYCDKYYNNEDSWQEATFVDVVDGQVTNSIDFSLAKYNGAISGNVSDVDGNPIENCTILASSPNNMEYYGNSGRTDEQGIYSIEGLPTGDYIIRAEYYNWIDDKNYASEWYDDAEDQNDATSISVVEPETIKNIDFVLEYGGAIKGMVLDPTGLAVYTNEADITVYSTKDNYINRASTDENGEFVVAKLSTGTYKLQVHYNGMKNYIEGNYNLENWYDGTTDFNDAVPIDVTISDTTKNIIINLHEGGKISGSVKNYNGEPINDGCEISVFLEKQVRDAGNARVENGIYTIDKLPTGRFKLYAEYNGYTQIVGQEPASEWYGGVHEFDNADFVEVSAPNETQNIDFTLERGGYISGRVYDPNGQLLSYSGQVFAYNLNYEMVSRSDILNEGMYFITGLPSGEYKLRVSYSGEEDYVEEWYNDKTSFAAATIVTVNVPNQTANINFTLDNPGTIQGFITDIHATRLTDEELLIDILCFDAVTGEYISDRNNSFNGGYQFELPGQDYKIAAVSYYTNWLPKNDNDSLAATFYENGLSFSDPNTKTITLESSATLTLNDIVMEKASGSISGTVYNTNNNEPITEGIYLVFVFDEDGYLSTASYYMDQATQIDGKYLTCGLRPGNYYLLAMAGDIFETPLSLWYNGITEDLDIVTFSPKVTIPEEAIPITVTDGETSGIDFYFSLTDIDENEEIELVKEYELKQNYPNPFNPSTTLKYEIPKESYITLKVYDILGREVATLVNKQQKAGYYEVDWNASNNSSGVYFYRIQAGDYVNTKKMILMK